MPKRTDLKKILLIGSGPIIIGQACEFDYSGTQACKALREEGYTVVLVNSNPATIMTDPSTADRTYIEPITWEIVAKIIEKERPDALLPTLGGQTGLNTAMDLYKHGILEKFGVEMIGARADVIDKAEDRQKFKQAMLKIGLEVPKSFAVHTLSEGLDIRDQVGLPCVIRPSFTMGGTGGGIAYNREEFIELVTRGLDLSPTTEVLIEESVIGWKEYELEVMRDVADNVVIICSIENFDPMGVHTGDSITVAPAQTLTDKEFQRMRDAALKIIREIGVETGGSNIQFATDPATGRMIVIEMNPRVSRSSALASKATGFPIAKIAAKLAVGYRLDELRNDITRETPACFEPTIDYVVTKFPRWAFEKFPDADSTLTTQMKSVGETMAIGRTFKESLQKALRGLETGRFGLGCDQKDAWGTPNAPTAEDVMKSLARPNIERMWHIRYAFKMGLTTDEIHRRSKIDPWFLNAIQEIIAVEDKLRACHNLESASDDLLWEAKQHGFADRQLAFLWDTDDLRVRQHRKSRGIEAVFKLVDTCAAEFEAYTPYYYSTYERPSATGIRDQESGIRSQGSGVRDQDTGSVGSADSRPLTPDYCLLIPEDETRPAKDGKERIVILGGGPNRIGQGIEFDYCCCHAAFALREAGYETIMINSNPETVSTDYDTSDHLFFEPLTTEDVLNICDRVKPKGLIVQFGGQTPLNLAKALEAAGAPIIGTSVDSIDMAEDRKRFGAMVDRLGLKQPKNRTTRDVQDAIFAAREIGFPVLVRPSFVLGGRAMEIVYDEERMKTVVNQALDVSAGKPILIDQFLESAVEVDVDCLADGHRAIIGGVMQHIEEAGIHSGDSACVIPPYSLPAAVVEEIKRQTKAMARELNVKGLMNVQFAVTGLRGHGTGARSQESGIRSQESGIRSQGSGVRGQESIGIAVGDPRSLTPDSRPLTPDSCPLTPDSRSPTPDSRLLTPEVYVLEVNPRASRTVPFVAKATNVPLAKLAALIMAGKTLDELGIHEEVVPTHFSVKESVFPFNKFPGVDIILGPEMRSTGEVMGIADSFPMAFAKSQIAASSPLPRTGTVFISVNDRDKADIIPVARDLAALGYRLLSTRGTGKALRAAGVEVLEICKLQEGRPNLIDYMKNGEVALVINTPSGKGAYTDEGKIRSAAVMSRVTCITTLAAAQAAVEACKALAAGELTVKSLQEWFATR